ncbi:hypothetical protein [Selenomonas ruminis]|uniref:Uncharacterized protein n=1 Tax=Selenomonas ruminis TaxID=2593411 RepID=A0A5D6W149_9FIRM|nr:hypothetical protein [Selenomonas sp. mPRGC5]TYZ20484.1 hypothetical protein FZ040_11740 [Selenomonas sp. mPRGC5]
MRTIVTDVDVERSCGGQYFTIYIKQGKLAGNMLLLQEAIADKGKKINEAAQDYIDKHEEDIPILAELLDIKAVGTVTRYLVDRSLASKSGMVFVENDSEEIEILVAELHETDSSICTFDDVLTSLEADCHNIPALRDSVEYHRPDEYSPDGEPLIHCYTSISGLFINKIV